ncbi:MAG TPA: VanZ family protein [Thermoplasmata archaeon]|nr:VanZ family protein [Thermoplasmata archaeon]
MRNRRAVALWGAVVAYAAAIFVASSFPAPAPEVAQVPVSDKALHALEYGLLALGLAIALATTRDPRIRSRSALLAFIAAALYGVSDEFHQTFVPSRVGDLIDLAWDVTGAAIAAVAYHVVALCVRGRAVSDTSPR